MNSPARVRSTATATSLAGSMFGSFSSRQCNSVATGGRGRWRTLGIGVSLSRSRLRVPSLASDRWPIGQVSVDVVLYRECKAVGAFLPCLLRD